MSRLSLIRQWNLAFTVFVFSLPGLGSGFLASSGSHYWPFIHWSSAAPILLVAAVCWGLYVNRVFLPGLVKGRVYLKGFFFMLFQAYLATVATMAAHQWEVGMFKQGDIATSAIRTLIMGAYVHVWSFVLSAPLFLACWLVHSYVLKFLYNRRDYLPEEK